LKMWFRGNVLSPCAGVPAAWVAAVFLLLVPAVHNEVRAAGPTPEADHAARCAATPLDESEAASLQAQAEDRLGTDPDVRAAALLKLAADRVMRASDSPRACERTLDRGEKRFEKVLRRQTRSVRGGAGDADSEDPAIRSVQDLLRDAFISDQAARLAYLDLATDDRDGRDYWARQRATAHAISVDGANTRLLEGLLDDYDWIDAHRFGRRISSHAWLMAQHADADPMLQQQVLERMAPYLENGGVRPRDYAYLFDRVAVNRGRPQRYGTQPMADCNEDGTLSPQPIEDPESVDARRAELGMEPMAEAMGQMAATRCR